MTFTYVLSTEVGKMRLMIPDRVPSEVIFSDEELTVFLSLEGNVLRRGVAAALESIATDEALVQKVITIRGLTTNGPALAKELTSRAATLREQAAVELASFEGMFDVAEQIYNPHGYQEALWNSVSRNG